MTIFKKSFKPLAASTLSFSLLVIGVAIPTEPLRANTPLVATPESSVTLINAATSNGVKSIIRELMHFRSLSQERLKGALTDLSRMDGIEATHAKAGSTEEVSFKIAFQGNNHVTTTVTFTEKEGVEKSDQYKAALGLILAACEVVAEQKNLSFKVSNILGKLNEKYRALANNHKLISLDNLESSRVIPTLIKKVV